MVMVECLGGVVYIMNNTSYVCVCVCLSFFEDKMCVCLSFVWAKFAAEDKIWFAMVQVQEMSAATVARLTDNYCTNHS